VERKGWGKTRAYPKIDESTLKNVQTELMKNPNAPMLMNVVLNKFGDAETLEYLADYFGYLLPILRKDTGAAIAAEEWRTYFDTYIPMGGVNKTDNESRFNALTSRVRASDTELEGDSKLRRLLRNYQAKKEAASLDPNAVKAKVQALLAQNNDDAEAVLKQLTKAERMVASKWLKEE
jgi:hypothetical protein